MNIAILSTFYPFRGGIAQFSAALYRELEKQHTVRAFTFSRQYPRLFFPGKTQYVTESDRADPVPAQPLLDCLNPITYWRTAAAIRAFRPDLLVTTFWMPFFAPSMGTVSARVRKSGARVISVVHNVIPHEPRPGDKLLLRYFLNRSDAFVVMNRSVARDLLALKPGARYALQPHPIYDHFGAKVPAQTAREKLALPVDKKIILFFGFIRRYKGLDNAIRAMAFLSDDYRLVIAGEMYGDFSEYERLIHETGCEQRIIARLQYIPEDEVPLYFSAADVLLLPYTSATQSGIMQIAYHYNLPAIVTDVGGLAEMIEDGKTGLVVRSTQPEALAAACKRYFDQGLQEPFSRAMATSKDKFTWAEFARAIIDLYEKIA